MPKVTLTSKDLEELIKDKYGVDDVEWNEDNSECSFILNFDNMLKNKLKESNLYIKNSTINTNDKNDITISEEEKTVPKSESVDTTAKQMNSPVLKSTKLSPADEADMQRAIERDKKGMKLGAMMPSKSNSRKLKDRSWSGML